MPSTQLPSRAIQTSSSMGPGSDEMPLRFISDASSTHWLANTHRPYNRRIYIFQNVLSYMQVPPDRRAAAWSIRRCRQPHTSATQHENGTALRQLPYHILHVIDKVVAAAFSCRKVDFSNMRASLETTTLKVPALLAWCAPDHISKDIRRPSRNILDYSAEQNQPWVLSWTQV